MDTITMLTELTAIPAPAGFEQALAEKTIAHLGLYMDHTYVDTFGNAIGLRTCGRPKAKRLLLDAHLDEVGLLVSGIEDGFLRFRAIGGVDSRVLPNQSVRILTTPPLAGLICSVPPHLQQGGQNKGTPLDALWVDVGLCQDDATRRIPIGTPMVFDSPLVLLQNNTVASKALDDRAGLAVLLATAEQLKEDDLLVDLCFMGSTREEIGGAGARVGTFSLNPDACLVVDVTHGKTPDAPPGDVFPLGKGPAIGIGPNMTRDLSQRLIALAKEHDIPWQTEVMGGSSGTNGWGMQISREGLPTALLSIPLRYMHSPNEVVHCHDIQQTIALLVAFIRDFSKREGGDCL